MGKIKQIIAQYGDTLENTYPVTLAEAVMYYKEGKLSSLKEYLDELKVEATGEYLPLPKDNTTEPSYLIGSNDNGSETYKVSQIPAKFLPSYVDDVIEGYYSPSNSKFYLDSTLTEVINSETGKIYVDKANNLSYRWTGSTYVEIGKSTVLNDAGSTNIPVYISGGKAVACDWNFNTARYMYYPHRASTTVSVTYTENTTYYLAVKISSYNSSWTATKRTLYLSLDNLAQNSPNGIITEYAGIASGWNSSSNYTVHTPFRYDYGIITGAGVLARPVDGCTYVVYRINTNANCKNTLYLYTTELGIEAQACTTNEEVTEFLGVSFSGNFVPLDGTNMVGSIKARQLQTARKLWGNNFDGTGDVNGTIKFAESSDNRLTFLNEFGQLIVGINNTSASQFIGNRIKYNNNTGNNICTWGALTAGQTLKYWSVGKGENDTWLQVYPTGNVTIGGASDTGYKLDVQGSMRCTGDAVVNIKSASFLGTDGNGKLKSVSLTKNMITSALGYIPLQTDSNTTYSAGGGLNLSGTTFSLKTGYSSSGKNYKVQLDASGNPFVNVPWTDNNTTYAQANANTLGLVKIGYAESGRNYSVKLNSSGQMYVNVPWTDTDTNTDTMVSQVPVASTASDADVNLPILASMSSSTSSKTGTSKFSSKVYLNPKNKSITAEAFYQTSDINKKDIHGNINLSIEDILSIPTIEFNYKEDDKTHIGTIAQEVEKVCPEIVQTDNEGFKSVDYAKLSVLAIKALKDTHEELSSLKEEVEQIKALLHGKV